MRSESQCNRSARVTVREWLASTRFEAEVVANRRYCGQWRIAMSGHFAIPFHIIGAGGCLLRTGEGERSLAEGDWLLFPRDTWHELVPLPGLEAPVIVLCGHIRPVTSDSPLLLDWLPDIWHVRRAGRQTDDSLQMLTQLFVHEAREQDNRLILNRLCEALLAVLLRDYAEALDARGGLLAAGDPRLARALLAMHRQPEASWTVDSLSETAAMSRTAFALAFHRHTGLTPMDYLTRWRMNRALALLNEGRTTVNRVAEQVGYQSESAFRKAFRRVMGKPLAAYRA